MKIGHVICSSIMGASSVKWGVAWILTIPISALMGFVAFMVIRLIVGS
ncbi:MAG: hypothetical protein WCJ47_01795 [Methanomicrobiales archaeon]